MLVVEKDECYYNRRECSAIRFVKNPSLHSKSAKSDQSCDYVLLLLISKAFHLRSLYLKMLS